MKASPRRRRGSRTGRKQFHHKPSYVQPISDNIFLPQSQDRIDPYDKSIKKIANAQIAAKKLKRHGSPPPHSALNKKQQQDFYSKLDAGLVEMMQTVPEQAKLSVISKWKELRPLNIYEIESKNPGSFVT